MCRNQPDCERNVTRDRLLALLSKYREAPLPWHLDDLCFLHLDVFRYISQHEDPLYRESFLGVLSAHNRECGGCLTNVRASAESTNDREKKRVYLNLHVVALQEFAKTQGRRFDVEEQADGAWIHLGPPPGLEELVVGIDMYAPRDTSKPGFHFLRAASKEVFDDPGAILQVVDEAVATEVRDSQSRADWNVLQWGAIVPTVKCTAFLYWKGHAKVIAEEMSLLGRYRALVSKHSDRDRDEPPSRDDPQTSLTLRELAFKYDGRTRFAGYAKAILKYREIDRYRHSETDAMSKATLGHGGDAEEDRREVKESEEPAVEEWQADHSKTLDRIDLDMRLRKLGPMLTEREKAIVALLGAHPDLSDGQIASRLACRRETINRDRRKIAKKARELGL